MNSSKTLERRAFLASTTATVVTLAAGCEEDSSGKATTDAGTPGEAGTTTSAQPDAQVPGTTTSGSMTGTSDAGPEGAGSADASVTDAGGEGTSASDASTWDAATDESSSVNTFTSQGSSETVSESETSTSGTSSSATSSSGSSSSSTSEDSSSSSGSSTGDSSTAETTATSDGSSADDTTTDDTTTDVTEPPQDECVEGGGTDGGIDQDGGPGVLCSTDTFNGDHCHPLIIPESDISLYAYNQYVLEDGGTGHTHVMYVSAYEIGGDLPGPVVIRTADDETGHFHDCIVTWTSTT